MPLEFDHYPDYKAEAYDRHYEAKRRGANCDECPLRDAKAGPVLHIVRPMSRLVVVGEAPGPTEVERGEPFVGKSGDILNQELRRGGLVRSEVSILNVQACQPPRSLKEHEQVLTVKAKREGQQVVLPREQCRPYFERSYFEARADSNMTLALGAYAQHAIEVLEGMHHLTLAQTWGGPRPVKKIRPSKFELHPDQHDERTRWAISSYHPAFAMRDKKWMNIVKDVIARSARIAARKGRLDWFEPRWLDQSLGSILFWLRRWREQRASLTVDIEGPKGGPIYAARKGIYCIGIGDDEEHIIVIPLHNMFNGNPWWSPAETQVILHELQRMFEVCPMTGQFFQYDSEVLAQMRLRHRDSLWRDTLHLHKATNENDHKHDLGTITRRFFDCEIYKVDPEGKDTALEAKDNPDLHTRCARDVLTTRRAAAKLAPAVAQAGTRAQYETDIQMAQVCRDMTELGLPVDLEKYRELVSHFAKETQRTSREFRERSQLPEQFNPASWQQVQSLVFKDWGYLPTLISDGKEWDEERHEPEEASTSRPALVALIDRGMDPTHESSLWSYLTYKQVAQTFSTLKNLNIQPHPVPEWARLGYGLARPEWRSDVIPTGRLVARKFPVQLLQKRAFGGKNVLNIFKAPPGYKFVGGDWRQVELRAYTIVANDRYLLKAIREGLDPHTLNAAALIAKGEPLLDVYQSLLVGPEDELKYFRQYAKIAAFREIYGGSDTVGIFHGMRAELNKVTGERLFPELTQEDVDEGHESWHKLHPETRMLQDQAVVEWRRTGCITCPILDQRKRFFFEEDLNAMTNAYIQPFAAALANRQSLLTRQWLGHRGQGGQTRGLAGPWSGMCVQIHDDQRFLVREEVAEVGAQVFDEAGRFEYTNAAGASMPFACDVEITETL